MQTSICLAVHGFIGRPFLPRAPAFLHASAAGSPAVLAAAVLHAQAALILTSPTRIHSLVSLPCLLAHLTCNIITHSLSRHTTKLASILTRISFVTSDTDRDTNIYISAATPSHPPPPLGRTAHSRPTRPPCISLRSSHSTIQGQTSPPPRRARHSQTQLQTSRS
jgi:hypothetical protein